MGKNCPSPSQTLPHPEKTFFGSDPMVSVAASQALSSCCSPLCRHAGRKRPEGIFSVSPGDRHGGNCGGRHGKTLLRITGRPAAVCSPPLLPCPAGDQSKRFWQEEGSARGGGRPFFKKGPSSLRPIPSYRPASMRASSSAVFSSSRALSARLSTLRRSRGSVLDMRRLKRQLPNSRLTPSMASS